MVKNLLNFGIYFVRYFFNKVPVFVCALVVFFVFGLIKIQFQNKLDKIQFNKTIRLKV